MGFLTPALLGGATLIALPIILHLVMRRQPRQLVFPALQFVRQRREANQRRLNLRHWLLLALRCALIAGLAVALARPTLKGSGLRGKEGSQLAVALVLDNSLRMQYVRRNRTRLEQAAEMAQGLVSQLPEGTEVAVLDRSRSAGGFAIDLGMAESRLRNLVAESSPQPLENAVHEAIQLVSECEDCRQEVFLFSDLSAASLTDSALQSLNEALTEAPEVRVYLVDVGVDKPRNRALAPLQLSSNTLRPGESLHIDAALQVTGFTEAPLVELYLLDDSEIPIKRGQQIVELTPEGTGLATFELANLALGIHQGFVRLAATDPLAMDNTRYFTVEVRPPAKVLLLGEQASDALFLREALQPSLLRDQASTRFQCEVAQFAKAGNLALDDFDAVCLLDPPPLSEKLWQALTAYADNGGGVGIFLGHRARPSGFNEGAAAQLLPGTLKLRSRYATYFRPRGLSHPALAGLRDYAEEIPWQVYPVLQYWEFGDLAGDAYVIARFANNQPALLERPVGRGRVLTLATTVSDPLEPVGREPWNLLPTGPEPWPFVALCNQLVGYLAQSETEQLDFFAGETVQLHLASRQHVSSFVLHPPEGASTRRTLAPGDEAIRISTTRRLGNYRVSSGGHSQRLERGFSINASPELSALERVDPDTLVAALPPERVHVARTLGDVERYVDIGRRGRELFSWAILLVTLIWGSEHLLANRFYRGAA